MTWVNSLGHVLFPFSRWQHDHARTPTSTRDITKFADLSLISGMAERRFQKLLHVIEGRRQLYLEKIISVFSLSTINYRVDQK